jgi:hypothetical protein
MSGHMHNPSPGNDYCRFMYLDLQTIACVLYRAHQVASHVLVSTWLATLSRACAWAIQLADPTL